MEENTINEYINREKEALYYSDGFEGVIRLEHQLYAVFILMLLPQIIFRDCSLFAFLFSGADGDSYGIGQVIIGGAGACLAVLGVTGLIDLAFLYPKKDVENMTLLYLGLAVLCNVFLWIRGLRPDKIILFIISIIIVVLLMLAIMILAYLLFDLIMEISQLREIFHSTKDHGRAYLDGVGYYCESVGRYNDFVEDVNTCGALLDENYKAKRKQIDIDNEILLFCPEFGINSISLLNANNSEIILDFKNAAGNYIKRADRLRLEINSQIEYIEATLKYNDILDEIKKTIGKYNRSDIPDSTRKIFLDVAEKAFEPLNKKSKTEKKIKKIKRHLWNIFF